MRGTSIAQRKADLERIIEIAQSTHVDRGFGYERIVMRGDKCVWVEPIFGGKVRVPFAQIVRAAHITHYEFAEYER